VILIGRYRSPYSRRVAVSLRLLGFEYEHLPHTAWTHLTEVRRANPVGRVPALVLDDGETLFDSTAILDYLDQLVGAERALVPAQEPQRHRVLRQVAAAMGVLDKVVAALYEQTMHPPQKIHAPWVVHNEEQARGGLAWLEAHQADADKGCEESLTQAEVTSVAMFDFTRLVNPSLLPAGAYPRLEQLSARCNGIPAFAATRPSSEVDRSNPALPDAAAR
jgi:glutathione S-transferase